MREDIRLDGVLRQIEQLIDTARNACGGVEHYRCTPEWQNQDGTVDIHIRRTPQSLAEYPQLVAAPGFPLKITAECTLLNQREEGGRVKRLWVRLQTPLYPEEAPERVFPAREYELHESAQLHEFLLLHLLPSIAALRVVRLVVQDGPEHMHDLLLAHGSAAKAEEWGEMLKAMRTLIQVETEIDGDGRLTALITNEQAGKQLRLGVDARLQLVTLPDHAPVAPFMEEMLVRPPDAEEVGATSEAGVYLEHAGIVGGSPSAVLLHPSTIGLLHFIYDRLGVDKDEENE